jgi:Flp pilus assembly protein TadG
MRAGGMSILRGFWRHEKGSSFESTALLMSVIAVLSVAAADLFHYASMKDGVLTRLVSSMRSEVAQAGTHNGTEDDGLRGPVDYTPTGSIIGLRHPSTLNPCTGEQK